MQINEIIAKTKSSTHSARAALNAQGEAYAYLEAVRTGTENELLLLAATNYQEVNGCTTAEAFKIVGQRGTYLDELARGESTFHTARKQLQAGSNKGPAAQPA